MFFSHLSAATNYFSLIAVKITITSPTSLMECGMHKKVRFVQVKMASLRFTFVQESGFHKID